MSKTTSEPEVSTSRRPAPWAPRVVVGAVLLAIGVDLLLEQIIGYDISLFPLAVGIGLLALWAQNRRSAGYLIAGSIVTGWGTGLLIRDLTGLEGIVSLGLAGGFAYLAWRSDRASWAWWPAAIFGIIGLLGIAGDLTTVYLFAPAVARIGAPIVAIALGLVLLARPKLKRNTFTAITVALVVVGVLMGASIRSPFSYSWPQSPFRASRATSSFHIPDLDGRRLVVELGSGSIAVVNGNGPLRGSVSARRLWFLWTDSDRGTPIMEVRETSSEVTLRPQTSATAVSLRLTVPEGADVRLRTGSGDLSLQGKFGSLDVETGSGDVEGSVNAPDDEFFFTTGSGDIDLIVRGNPSVRASTGSGDLEVNEREMPSFQRDGSTGTLTLKAGSGDISLLLPDVPGS
ncbi:MAG: DUF4097 domain-containing protein [Actinobacteria bacterium]|nr:DUF4097 domain-containing protein [Actinomycetota bacterium]